MISIIHSSNARQYIRRQLGLSGRRASISWISSQSYDLAYDRDTGIIWQTSSSQRIRPLYQTIIGIEIHAQLAIPTKLFSPSPTTAAAPNTHVHPFDLGYPGTLPSLSYSAVRASILSASALNCSIHKLSRFERKHYFYPDLPAGYQVTQQRWPLGSDGLVEFETFTLQQPKKKGDTKKKRPSGKSKEIQTDDLEKMGLVDKQTFVQLRIERLQLEQDTGKTTTHCTTDNNTTTYTSHIDYNRAGCALIEIVSHPDLRSAHEAAGAVEKIRRLLRHVGTCDGRMEMGSLRCDLNVSIAPLDDEVHVSSEDISKYVYEMRRSRSTLPKNTGDRVEVKNLNSLRQIIAATEYEALRQSESSLNSNPTGRETRTFLVKPTSIQYPLGGETFCIRSKGDAVDYRFMPEPDIPPLILDGETLGYNESSVTLEDYISDIMPESLEEAAARLSKDYGLSDEVIGVIISDTPAIALLDDAVNAAKKEVHRIMGSVEGNDEPGNRMDSIPTLAANLLCNDLFALVKRSALEGIESSSLGDDEDDLQSALNHPISVEFSKVNGERLGALVSMLVDESITASMAKKILAIMYNDDLTAAPQQIAEVNKFRVIADMDELVALCESVVLDQKNAKQLEQYRLGGKNTWKIEKFFFGKIMANSGGNAHPEKMKEALALVLKRVSS
eukprot:scaffold21566_cov73-Cyclotella_meneghiniana.AAC.13